MDKKEELKHTKALVKKLLIKYPMARDSDSYLYIRVCKELNPEVCNMDFANVMLHLKELGLPCFETVRRSRAYLQSHNPELKGSEKVQDYRTLNEEIYREFYGN